MTKYYFSRDKWRKLNRVKDIAQKYQIDDQNHWSFECDGREAFFGNETDSGFILDTAFIVRMDCCIKVQTVKPRKLDPETSEQDYNKIANFISDNIAGHTA